MKEVTEKSSSGENKLIADRREKLGRLRIGNAFPNDFRRDSLAGELLSAYGERSGSILDKDCITVRVAGRMMAKRIMGKASFIKIQDSSGQIQIYIEKDRVSVEIYQAFKSWDVGDILGVEGELFKTKTGELSIRAEQIRLLVKSLRPMPEKWHGLVDQELKVRQRYVDLIVSDETRRVFQLRTEIIRFLRSSLDTLGFLEVETPMMHPIPGGAIAKPFATHHNALDIPLYLRVAPELYLKRLLVGGFERVYEINRSFRNEGISTQHNPEFTMLEVYQAYANYRDFISLTQTLIRESARMVVGSDELDYQGQLLDLKSDFEEMTIEEGIIRYNPDLADAPRDLNKLRSICDGNRIKYQEGFGPGKLQIELFESTVEHHLKNPVFVTDYPAEVSPLARCKDEDPFLTDRFELFIAGKEIANGFSELNDPEDQAMRFKNQAQAKADGDDEAMYFDDDYIKALEYGMPPAAGLGIGVDRLIMLLTNSQSIRDVLLFPHLKPEI